MLVGVEEGRSVEIVLQHFVITVLIQNEFTEMDIRGTTRRFQSYDCLINYTPLEFPWDDERGRTGEPAEPQEVNVIVGNKEIRHVYGKVA